jgi:hypothetical protein
MGSGRGFRGLGDESRRLRFCYGHIVDIVKPFIDGLSGRIESGRPEVVVEECEGVQSKHEEGRLIMMDVGTSAT